MTPTPFTSMKKSLMSESERLHTFIGWSNTIEPVALAESGFFYLRNQDRVMCIFCDGVLSNWTVSDNSRERHERELPNCSFMLGQPVGNIPTNCSTLVYQIVPPVGPITRSRSNPQYSELDRRHQSYLDKGWPDHVQTTPEALAEAGFYYC